MPTKEEIAEMDKYLESRGGRISNMTQRGQKAMCHGMCLDWIRRILGGNKTRFDKYEGDHGVLDQEKAELSGKAWLSNAIGLSETSREKRLRKMREIHDLRETTISDTVKRLQQELEELSAQAKQASTMNQQQQAQLLKTLEAKRDTLQLMMIFGASHPTFWKTFGELWNSREAKRQDKDASFHNISGALIGDYMPVFAFGQSAEQMWAEQIREYVLEVAVGNCATLLLAGSEADHAVAVHRVHDTSLEFFDPNFGEFVFGTNGFPETLAHLVMTIYKGYTKICKIEFKRRQL